MTDQTPERTDPATQARKAMERARAAARDRGKKPGKTTWRRGGKGATRPDSKPYGRGRDPISVSEGLDGFVDRMGWREQLDIASVGARWAEIVGTDVAEHSEVVSFEGGVLTLKATTTAWAEQLAVVSGRLRQRVNDEVGRPLVTRIRVLRPTQKSWTKGPLSVKGRGPRDTYG